ncbi:polyadenylate-binding protein-interacting protein 1 [Brachyhypopomus gauderio]|uniref:polyadenylate-binding protein-interacting protein 1 n=1 Tax=Brachyhypopomus gauderio TaxID=698409 RepID=UPI0040419016
MTDSFNRAPGAGRNLGAPSPAGLVEVIGPFQPERGHGDSRASVFVQHEPLRQPRTCPPPPEDTGSGGTGGTDSRVSSQLSHPAHGDRGEPVVRSQTAESLVRNSQLSASAPEFVPASLPPPHDDVYEDGSEGYYTEPSMADWVQEVLSHLNSSPGSFESDIDEITATLNNWVTTMEILQQLVELVFTQSTSMPNFTYTGARLCNHLSQHLTQSPGRASFRQLLLKRCHVEFERRMQALAGDEQTQRRFHSYVLFLGELYLNLEVRTGKAPPSRADVLLGALKDLIDTLCSHPTDANLICAIKLLKLTGSVLEDAWKHKGLNHMDDLIQRMKDILLDAKGSRNVREMLLQLVEVRSSNWGRVNAAAAYSEATPDNDPNYYMNEPTFYTADGTPFTAADPEYSEKYQEILEREDLYPELFEENGNEALYADEEEMDPEIEEAFEKFCLESEGRRKP